MGIVEAKGTRSSTEFTALVRRVQNQYLDMSENIAAFFSNNGFMARFLVGKASIYHEGPIVILHLAPTPNDAATSTPIITQSSSDRCHHHRHLHCSLFQGAQGRFSSCN